MVALEVDLLAKALYSLDEPWRSRFLILIANYATTWRWNGRQPTQQEVTTWLEASPTLYRWVRLLLDGWQRSGGENLPDQIQQQFPPNNRELISPFS